MSNALTTFNFNASTIRVVEIDGQPWFFASDVCDVLSIRNVSDAVGKLEPSEYSRFNREKSRGRPSLVISRSGVFALAMKSRKPEAREFRQWVTGVVLPSIQDNGGYILGQETLGKEGGMTDEQFLAEAALVAQRVIAAKDAEIARLSAENAAMVEELTFLTVDEYRSLGHAYWPRGFASMLGRRAKILAMKRGVILGEQKRVYVNDHGKPIPTTVFVYPKDILDEVYAEISYRLDRYVVDEDA